MPRSVLTRISVLAGLSAVLVLGSTASADATRSAVTRSARTAAPPAYRLIDLGTLGGEVSFATALNDRGTVVGRAQTADGTYHGFVWRHGVMTDLGLFSPTNLNNRNQIVGTRDDADGAFLWSRGKLKRLDRRLAHPIAINDRGQILGLKAVANAANVPALLSKGILRTLPLDSAGDLNNRGQVAGGRLIGTDGFHAGIWHRGRVTDLGAAAFNRSNSYGINAKGWVIGWTFSAQQDERGALWRHGVRTDLGTLGGNVTQAVAINDRGVILVRSQVPDGNLHAALWRRGVLTDLSAAGVGIELAGYNNRGEIAGAIRTDVVHAALFRPRR